MKKQGNARRVLEQIIQEEVAKATRKPLKENHTLDMLDDFVQETKNSFVNMAVYVDAVGDAGLRNTYTQAKAAFDRFLQSFERLT
jgi:hypothetical protein